MRLKWSTKYLLLPGLLVGASVAMIVLVDQFYEVHYTFIGIGTILVGITGFTKLWEKVEEAQHTASKVEHQINGGMSEAAKAHVEEALTNSEIEVGLWRRVDALEEAKQECVEREKRCEAENEKMRRWVIERLDMSGKGRGGDR
jgi:hypothetical protein